jgi:hypothetical protein
MVIEFREVAVDVALEVLPSAAVTRCGGFWSERALGVVDVEVVPVHLDPRRDPDRATSLCPMGSRREIACSEFESGVRVFAN